MLALAHPERLVTAGIGGTPETDLIPRPGMRIEGGAGITGPQRPNANSGQTVPLVGLVHRFDQRGLLERSKLLERPFEFLPGVGVEASQGKTPGVAILGHVVVDPAVRLVSSQAPVHQRQRRHFRFVVLGQQEIEQRPGDGLLHRGEKAERDRRVQTGQHHTSGDRIPAVEFVENVEAGKPPFATGRHGPLGWRAERHQSPSRRSSAASSPIPPTMAASRGAKAGGPISTL